MTLPNEDFESWMVDVDASVQQMTGGQAVYDIPDCPYTNWFEQDADPEDAAALAVHMAGY